MSLPNAGAILLGPMLNPKVNAGLNAELVQGCAVALSVQSPDLIIGNNIDNINNDNNINIDYINNIHNIN